jgi:peptide-methionine (S)-S-oxide reductase
VHEEKRVKYETAILGGGCFWCVEAVFERINGIIDVVSGYSGGTVVNPTYDAVSSGNTGHAEVVRIQFNPAVISYEEILEIFFYSHDPTTRNRQGADIGTQYRSIILYANREQQNTALAMIERLNISRQFKSPIATEVNPFEVFYAAEEYHQDFFKKNPEYGYCQIVIAPKLRKLSLLETRKGA